MLKRVQHKKKCVIPNQVLNLIQDLSISNLDFGNDKELNYVCINELRKSNETFFWAFVSGRGGFGLPR